MNFPRALFILSCLSFALLLALYDSPSVTAQQPVLPLTTPNSETGLAIYAERCANCHGEQAKGDGQMAVAAGISPIAFADPEYRKTASPAVMFETITNGRIENSMPPFGPSAENAISEEDRWNLVAALYSYSTPPESVATGQAVYETSCQNCHGAAGAADGPDATPETTNLTSLTYWFNRTNQAVFEALENGRIPAHAYQLSDDERWSVVDYARTFSYVYLDPLAPPPPIPAATITGHIVNGSTADFVTGGNVTLRAFNTDIEEMLTLTSTVGTEGRFSFDLADVPADWIYMVNYDYNGLNFNSPANQLSRANPTLEMPVTVFDQTTNSAAVIIEQIHIVLEFVEDTVQVSELYVVGNQETAVFMGATGDPADGTVQFAVPPEAQNVAFQRAFGSLDSFFPALDLIQVETNWADVQPLYPGSGSLNMLVQYSLPYEDGITFAHPLPYSAANTSIIMADTGVTVSGPNWVSQGIQTMGEGSAFAAYAGSPLAQGDSLSLTLEGTPRLVSNTTGSTVLVRDETNEILIGTAVLLTVLGVAVYTVRTWTQTTAAPTANSLLQAIADLDDAYENGRISQKQYTHQRQTLKTQLITIWQSNKGPS